MAVERLICIVKLETQTRPKERKILEQFLKIDNLEAKVHQQPETANPQAFPQELNPD
jgi:hypothetical protein